MKKWIWLVLVVLVAMGVMGIGVFFPKPETRQVIATTQVETSQKSSKQVRNIPQVSADKLFRHIQKLNFKRFTSSERSRSRNYITSQLTNFGWKPQLENFSEGVNIFAERQGTDKAAGSILVAAHYDTVAISPGADDNASGVAVVLEVARLFGRPTKRTLQLALFDQEEEGLLGSKAYVLNNTKLANLRGVIVMDMVGYACYTVGCQKYPPGLPVAPPSDKGDFLAAIGDAEHLPLLEAFQSSNRNNLPPVLTLPIPLKGLLTPDTLRSDHAPFWYQGVGAVLVTDTANLRNIHYHQASDIPRTIERSFFTGSAQIVINATARLLDSNELNKENPPA